MEKVQEKIKAVELRKSGFSYSEILKRVSVSKSSLSLWLRSVGLSNRQKQRLTEKKIASMQRGWQKVKEQRLDKTRFIKEQARGEVKKITSGQLWAIGTALYWAEGAKEKAHNVSQRVLFNNSDPLMIKIFLKWLKESVNIKPEEIKCEIYIHENSKNQVADVIKYWEQITGMAIQNVYFKKNKMIKYRKNIGVDYYGLLRVCVKRSTDLNRKIAGWIEGICENCGVVQR